MCIVGLAKFFDSLQFQDDLIFNHQKAQAEAVMSQTIETQPDCPQRWQWYADQLARLGRREEARQSRRRAQERRV